MLLHVSCQSHQAPNTLQMFFTFLPCSDFYRGLLNLIALVFILKTCKCSCVLNSHIYCVKETQNQLMPLKPQCV